MLKSVALLSLGALSCLAVPSSPGVCQQYATLSFKYPPKVASGLSCHVIASNLTMPRGQGFDNDGNLLVIERGVGLTSFTLRDDATCKGWERRVVISNLDLNHAVELGPGPRRGGVQYQYLYASSQENVFRWEYDPSRIAIVGNPVTLTYSMTNINPIPPDHVVRTILVYKDKLGRQQMIVTRGATGNWDASAANPESGPAQIRRFDLTATPPARGWSWQQGEILGWGLRNGVGVTMAKDGNSLWEVDNGPDNAFWKGIDVHNDNPVWNSSSIPGFNKPTGEQFSVEDPQVTHTDAWCNSEQNVRKPAMLIKSHSAPLDIVFYELARCTQGNRPGQKWEGLPRQWDGDAIMSLHGSWNRLPSTGYAVSRIPWSKTADKPLAPYGSTTGYETIVGAPDPTNCNGTCIRPVGLVWDKKGRLFVSSDETGEIFVIKDKDAP
ncbi:hypothetical protein FRC09_000142 [Ceratobasidium sp. 395]|nr:hypothetical protein FRC09_000142 [Ceratobasidium sp. 395]